MFFSQKNQRAVFSAGQISHANRLSIANFGTTTDPTGLPICNSRSTQPSPIPHAAVPARLQCASSSPPPTTQSPRRCVLTPPSSTFSSEDIAVPAPTSPRHPGAGSAFHVMGCASINSSIPMDGGHARAWRCGRAITLDRKARKLAEEFRSKGVLHSSWHCEYRKRDRRSSPADNYDYLIRTPGFETDATP